MESFAPPRTTSSAAKFATSPTTATISIGQTQHLGRLALRTGREPPDRTDRDGDSDDDEDDAVQERPEHLGAPETEGVAVGCGPRRDDGRDECDDEAEQIARHVPGIGQQGERAAQEGTDHLNDEEGADDRDRDPQAGSVRGPCVVVRVCHVLSSVGRKSPVGPRWE